MKASRASEDPLSSLIDMLARLGVKVRLVTSTRKRVA